MRPGYALFKMTWHPNWKVYIDGSPQPSAMLSPGFVGVRVMPGRHRIVCRYQPGALKLSLAIVGFLLLIAVLRSVDRFFGVSWRPPSSPV